MTTPTGTISMTDIQTEFGGAAPIGLNEYYAGGTYVPAGTSGIPSSGTISMNNLRGKSKFVPLTVTVSPTSTTEGSYYTVTVLDPAGINLSPIYWKLTDYSNLDNTDFETSSGTVYINYETSEYPSFSFRASADASYEGTGTFKLTVYSDAARTVSIGQSSTITVTDTYSVAAPTLSRSSIYRYANLNIAYRSSTVSMTTSGLEGATVYYEVYDSSGTLSSVDIDAPGSLTGTLTVPSGGTVSVVVRATDWNGSQTVTTDKNVYVRFRLNNSSGTILGTSSAILLYRMPVVSFSLSPSTIREGQTSTLTGSLEYVPYDATSVFWTTSGTANAYVDWLYGATSGEITWSQQIVTANIVAAIDTTIESDETLTFTFRLNSTGGTGFWAITLTIQDQAIISSAYASIGGAFIANASSYPEARTFSVQFRNGSGGWNDSNITSPSEVTISAGNVSSNSIALLSDPGGNSATHSMEYRFTNPAYAAYSVYSNENFTWPVYGLTLSATGSNSNGASRSIYAQITSTPVYGSSRTFSIQYSIKAAGSGSWGAWTSLSSVTVNSGATSSSNTLVYGPVTASAQFDLRLRCVLSGQEIRESNYLYNLWLG